MSRLDSIFSSGPACIVPMVLGDPDLDTTLAMAKELLRAGADAIELHLPFSDPTAEGELMQNGALRALKNGVTVKDAITFTQKAAQAGIPVILKSYANVVLHYGIEAFAEQAAQAGACALYLFDVPLEERQEFLPALQKHSLPLLSSISTGAEARLPLICQNAQGCLLCEGLPGEASDALFRLAKLAKEQCSLPLVLELGLCSPDQAAQAAGLSCSVSLGESIAAIIELYGTAAIPRAETYVAGIKAAMRSV